ncbi:hypothetical protein Tco_1344811 [Tanacetum coccineum]
MPEPSRPSKGRKLRKRASKSGSSALELGQAEGVNDVDLTYFCAEIENSLERDEGASARAASAPTPRLGKRLGAPPSVADVSASGPSHAGTSVHASTFGRNLSLGGAVVSGHARKSGAEVLRRQVDPLDFLAHSALARDVEYDQIPEDDLGTVTRGEEIDLTLFPLTPGPYQMSYPYEGLVTAKNHLQEKFDRKAGYVKVLRSEVMDLDGKLERMRNKELRSQKDDASDKVPRCMAWLDYDKHVDSLSTMDNEVGVPSPESTTQTLPSFEEYTPPVTYPKEVEKTLGTPIEVEPLNETKLEEVGLNCINDPKRQYGFKPGLLGKSVSLGVDISNCEMFDDDWGLESKEVSPLGEELSLFDMSDLEKEHTKSVYLRNEEDKRRGVEYVMSKILGFYKECLELGPEYLTGMDDEGEVT